MPTVEATRVRCPECGATVQAREGAATLKCEYCGTESRIQRRTQIFQLPVRMPPAAADHPTRVAVEVRTRSWPIVLFLLVTVGLPVGIPILVWISHKRGWGDHMMWESSRPIIGDVDGDGIADAVGFARYVQRDQMRLIAISGKDGHTLWETPSLGTYTDIYQSKLALAGGVVVRADGEKRTHAEGYDAKTGTKKWDATPAEIAGGFCAGSSPADVTLVTNDKRAWKLDVASGGLSPAPPLDLETCPPLPTNDRFRVFRSNEPHHRVAIDGMYVDHVLGTAAPFVVVGYKSPGTAVPMIAAIDESEHVLWKTEVPGHDPLAAKQASLDLEHVGIDDRSVGVVYERDDNQAPEVTVFDRATGARRFEKVADKKGTFTVWLHGVGISSTTFFVVVNSSLQAFDVATGNALWYVGQLD